MKIVYIEPITGGFSISYNGDREPVIIFTPSAPQRSSFGATTT